MTKTGMNDPNATTIKPTSQRHKNSHNPNSTTEPTTTQSPPTEDNDTPASNASSNIGGIGGAGGGIAELEQQMIGATAAIGKRSDKRKKSKPKPQHNADNNNPNNNETGNRNSVRNSNYTPSHINVAPPPDLDHIDFQKHLDTWLDNCLRDAPLTSSSSEFLGDTNNPLPQQQQQQQQQHPQSQQQQQQHRQYHHRQPHQHPQHQQQSHIHKASSTSSSYAKQRSANMNTTTNIHNNNPAAGSSSAAAAAAMASQLYGSSAKLYGSGTGPTATKPSDTPPARGGIHSNSIMHDPFGNYHKYFPMYPPHFGSGLTLNAPTPLGAGGYMLNAGSRHSINMNSDFSSLPPAVNMLNIGNRTMGIGPSGNESGSGGGGGGDASDHNLNHHMHQLHYSDPCLAGASDDSKDSGNGPTNTTARSPNSPKNDPNAKMLSTILEQIGALHETNTKICRNLHDNKVDIEALKHAPNWGLRHRRDSISGLSTHSQPLGYAAPFGTHSPAPTFHSGMYTPGMLTDVVREVKEAARVREDALLNRVKALVEERSWMMQDGSTKLQRDVDDLRSQVVQLRTERKDSHARIDKLEIELKTMRTLLTHVLHSQTSMHNAHHAPHAGEYYADSPPQLQRSVVAQQMQQQQQQRQRRSSLSLSHNMHGAGNGSDLEDGEIVDASTIMPNGVTLGRQQQQDSAAAQNKAQMDERIAQIVRDNRDLRTDLNNALESRKMAENKITSLENMVMKLQSSIIGTQHSSDATHLPMPEATAPATTLHHAHLQQIYHAQPQQHAHHSGSSNNSSRNASTSSEALLNNPAAQQATQAKALNHATSSASNGNNIINLIGPVTDL